MTSAEPPEVEPPYQRSVVVGRGVVGEDQHPAQQPVERRAAARRLLRPRERRHGDPELEGRRGRERRSSRSTRRPHRSTDSGRRSPAVPPNAGHEPPQLPSQPVVDPRHAHPGRGCSRRAEHVCDPGRRRVGPACRPVTTAPSISRSGSADAEMEAPAAQAAGRRASGGRRGRARGACRARRVPVTTPYDSWYGAGCSIAGGCGGGAVITRAALAFELAVPMPPILAHLDMDAFFAAVEELETPALRTQPLVVGGDPQGRGVVATANYVARRFGIRSAMSSAEALRRCPDVVFVRPRHALYRQYSQAAWTAIREVVPARRAGRDRRGLPRPRHGRGVVRRGALASPRRCRRRCARRRRSPARSESRPRRWSARSPRTGASPAGSPSSRPGARRGSSRRSRCARCPGVGPRAEERLAAAGVTTIGALAGLSDLELRAVLPGSVGVLLRDRVARDRSARPRARGRAGLDLGRGDVRARHLRRVPPSTPSCDASPTSSPSACAAPASAAGR